VLLSGSGIAEETPFRLVLLSTIWKVAKRKWPAIVLSALVLGAYHLTPLSGMYRVFRKYPVSQFSALMLIGLVWGYLFTKRCYETSVLGHAFSNWLPLMVFGG
jgi:membrane protease YdiL (CAAX protease family)